AVYEMWAELYPQDIQAQRAAAEVRNLQDDRIGAIEKLEQVLELNPTDLGLLQEIGSLYQALGDLDTARRYFQRYADANPEDKESFTALAGLDRDLGDHAQARELYERARLLEPGDLQLTLDLAALDRDVGDFEGAKEGYERALAAAGTAAQRYRALRGLRQLHEYRGSYRAALEDLQREMMEFDASQPPLARVQFRLLTLGLYIRAGQPDKALAMLDSMAIQLQAPMNSVVPLGQIRVFEALGRVVELEAAVDSAQAVLDRTGLNTLESTVVWGRGRLHELRGEWEDAIAAFERERELSPTDAEIPARLGRCHREQGDLDRAESLILETLRARPSYGPAHLELARVYEAMDRPLDAIQHLEQALETWAPADPDYQPAQEARAMLERLRATA
ncbi:MAG: tetratricopeptide repeat protein, partial [Gemmatimonadota bacterium]